jgi:hypothetical protein
VINIGCSGWPIGKHRNSPPHWRVKDVLTYFESHGLQVSDDWYAPQPERGAGIQPHPFSFYFSPVGGTALIGSLRSVRSSFATHSPAHSLYGSDKLASARRFRLYLHRRLSTQKLVNDLL